MKAQKKSTYLLLLKNRQAFFEKELEKAKRRRWYCAARLNQLHISLLAASALEKLELEKLEKKECAK
ncbi:hypothetical protein HF668_04120 [Acidithiobacillus ferridurans]|uniref:hypothetical protein n=1 Tax=Acidithiobacillus ferridurans TaxID=1232575 RepID=UPI001C07B530|nr:hypothetical protein [Acidithiobacillus ferridurans]MBU2804355.1 hypothetical protein [Acidithiobacillus ferridurans]